MNRQSDLIDTRCPDCDNVLVEGAKGCRMCGWKGGEGDAEAAKARQHITCQGKPDCIRSATIFMPISKRSVCRVCYTELPVERSNYGSDSPAVREIREKFARSFYARRARAVGAEQAKKELLEPEQRDDDHERRKLLAEQAAKAKQ